MNAAIALERCPLTGVPTECVPPVPRVLEFVTVKRNIPILGRSYGHWWIEVDGTESYGWWPARSPLRTRDVLLGGAGVLNGAETTIEAGARGGANRDPNHGLTADYEFNPILVTPRTNDDVRHSIRTFATSFEGRWRWSTRPTMNCRLFQLALFEAAGMVDGTGNYRTRGGGCPLLGPLRRVATRLSGRRYWPTNLPAPGRPASDVLGPESRPTTGQAGQLHSASP